eukprot:GFUD01003197.1.p1 GENE.GFUD01003197.1~~GFUD01003197.1.p1  ORF type:complete len:136 (-),score=18.19 GFUD01003197.1:109-516(-)
MPKYFCDYCDTYLTHDSPSVRKTHCAGRKHKENVKFYYQKWMEEQAQNLIDATTAAFKSGKLSTHPHIGPAVPPPSVAPPFNGHMLQPMAMRPPPHMGMPPNFPPGMVPPNGMVPGMRPPMGIHPGGMMIFRPTM